MTIQRDRSKLVFGNRYMLEVCEAVGRSASRVSLSTLLNGQDLSPSVYSGPVNRLVRAGLLHAAPLPTDDRRERWYNRADSSLWVAAIELSELEAGDR